MLRPVFFLIMISDINKDVSGSNLISFTDDTRIYIKFFKHLIVTFCNKILTIYMTGHPLIMQ